MGSSHARAYHAMPEFEIVGLVSRGATSRRRLNAELGGRYPEFSDYADALALTRPDAVCISTYTETHADFAMAALEAGAHVFLEKPVADTNEACVQVIAAARDARRALVVGYILQVHPAWQRFTGIAHGLGRPLVMRMNLNQQSAGAMWDTHRQLLRSTSPIVDCGVHYVDVMCRMTGAHPVRVNGVAARLSDEIGPGQTNYGHLQVVFDDGSVGWYEAGWGPMMSETAFFVKDVIGPKGAVSIVAERAADRGRSADIDAHTMTEALRVHHAERRPDGTFARGDEVIASKTSRRTTSCAGASSRCSSTAIQGRVDLEAHWTSAADSLRIVLAADQSAREGRTIEL